MLCRTLMVFSCVLFISIHTDGQNNYYGNYGYNGGYVNWAPRVPANYGNEKVNIQLYYEALCPACKQFDTHELRPTVLELGPYLEVELHPYGNAKTISNGYGGYEFKSQHGPEETYGDKLHACAIDILKNQTSSVLFNSCLMEQGNGSDDVAADICGRTLYMNSDAIKQCAKSNRGSQLLKYHGDVSKIVGFKTVPTVLVNGQPAECENFKQTVCKAFNYPPPECRM